MKMIEEYISDMKDELISFGYSEKTIKTYKTGLNEFYRFIDKPVNHSGKDDIKRFKIFLVKKNTEPKTINTYLAAVKFFYRNVLNRKIIIRGVKQKKKLPVVHSRDFILNMIDKTKNLKHKMLINLLYSSGLRVSEAVKIKISDIDLDRKCGMIREGKGRKDRKIILSDSFVKQVREYMQNLDDNRFDNGSKDVRLKNGSYKRDFLFSGRDGHMSIRTAQMIVKQAGKRVSKDADVFCHSLRSSFATHLLEDGTELKFIKELLGHEDSRTTEVYLRLSDFMLSKVKSPMDRIKIKDL